MRTANALLFSLAIAAGLHAGSVEKHRIKVSTTEVIPFAPGGVIRILNSFGEVKVEGWDRPEVEITVLKGTNKKYSSRDEAKAWEHLDRVQVELVKEAEDRMVISTTFPPRSIFTRPLKGKTNVQLIYRIKVPARVDLHVKHDIGEVAATNLCGNIEVTNRIGAVTLRLPEDDDFHVDARSRIGDVQSAFGPPTERKLLVGAQVRRHGADRAHQVYLRVGIGEIDIKKIPQPRYPLI
jgi:hypothetical protein